MSFESIPGCILQVLAVLRVLVAGQLAAQFCEQARQDKEHAKNLSSVMLVSC